MMCFSAGASFTSAVVLSLIGVMTLREVRQRAWYGIAVIPFLFAIQQATEGMVWVSQGADLAWIYFYLFFAVLVWPLCIPLSLWMIERDKKHAYVLAACVVLGLCTTALFMFNLLEHEVSAAFIGHHIQYYFKSPFPHLVVSATFYCIPVIGSCFVSSNRWVNFFGCLIFGAALVSWYVWTIWFTSVWCFFAALISGGVYLMVRSCQRS